MKFAWDPRKRESNLKKHNVDFEDILAAFDDEGALVFVDERREYGEPRFVMIAETGGLIYTIVFTARGDTLRIISARRANRKEREHYGR